jgi:hypothetical protein
MRNMFSTLYLLELVPVLATFVENFGASVVFLRILLCTSTVFKNLVVLLMNYKRQMLLLDIWCEISELIYL